MFKLLLFIAGLSIRPAVFAADIKTDAVMNALTKELNRSFKGFSDAEQTPLYYLSYEVTESKTYYLRSKMGAINNDSDYANRKLDIDMRVNTPELDNTHQVKGDYSWTNESQALDLPLSIEGNEDALRARIWEYTDKAYKKAQENFTKVRMNKAVTAAEDDPSPDFSASKPEMFYETVALPEMDKKL